MNKWLLTICLSFITFCCQAEIQKLNSTIKAVTVYNDRAAITRFAQIKLGTGTYTLVFENLPADLDDASLQVDSKATGPMTILDVTTKPQYLFSHANERLQQIAEQMKVIQHELLLLNDKEALLKEQHDFIIQMQGSTVGISDKVNRPSLEQIQQIMALSDSSLSQVVLETRQVVAKKEQLNNQLQVLRNDQYPLQRKTQSKAKNVSINVTLEKPEEIDVSITYITRGARWQPVYDARFNSHQQKLLLNYLASISQQTGEDWQDVKLTLSTARPSFIGSMPVLTAWNVSPNVSSNKKISFNGAENWRIKQRADTYQLAQTPAANVDTSITNTAFTIVMPITLHSGGNEQKVTINSIADLKTELQYKIVPRLQQAAFLQAEVKNNSNYPLLAGALNIFMDGRFIATGRLSTTMPDELFKIGLGVDESINITHKAKRSTKKTGFTNSGERVSYEYLTTVQNNKVQPVSVIIQDNIPVSQNEKIKVTLSSPKNITPDQEGMLSWKMVLKPMEKVEIPVKFAIDYPVDTKVIGL